MARQLMEEMGREEQLQLLVQRETYSRCHTPSVRGGVGGARVGRQKWTNLLIAVISTLLSRKGEETRMDYASLQLTCHENLCLCTVKYRFSQHALS